MDMDMSSSSSTIMTSSMEMVFFTAHDTPLYSSSWRPSSPGAYAGTCLFLIFLSIFFRAVLAWKTSLSRKWLIRSTMMDAAVRNAVVRPMEKGEHSRRRRVPFRLSIDVPRALVLTVLLGIGYLLMLAVMTMNVGYFLSVLAGGFLGELLFGRLSEQVTAVEAHMC